jgi:hypothetical protein
MNKAEKDRKSNWERIEIGRKRNNEKKSGRKILSEGNRGANQSAGETGEQ